MKGKNISEEIKEIIEIAKKSGIEEFNLEIEGLKISFKFTPKEITSSVVTEILENKTEKPKEVEKDTFLVKSPLVGVFYRKPNPNAKPFVEIGDIVEKGQTLCIVETMKIMNEIQTEKKGKILKIFPEDGSTVEAEQPLFELEAIYED
uniref:Biotin carboxyl carrier protein of acetyl-CoA carboxylase n=1 Tax=Caldisericum exile TaxID=693075 RepID=A0A7C4TV73_9BACT